MIRIDNMTFGYGQKHVIRDLSLSVGAGQVCGLLGLNGEGKTTLMKLIAGLQRAPYGSISVMGHKPSERNPNFLADVYYMPEVVRPSQASTTDLAAAMSRFYPRFSYETLGRTLGYFDIDPHQPMRRLSMGQVKKAHTCLAFATGARLMLLDEPTNGLDIPSKIEWRRVVAESMDDDRSIIISSHQVRDIDTMLDSVMILSHGNIVFHHSLAEVGERLEFADAPGGTQADDELYSMPTAMGRRVIRRQSAEGQESLVDLEMLFAAVLSNGKNIENAINR